MQDKGVGLASESRFLHETGSYVAVYIRELILNLPAKERQALYLHYLGLNYAEIANVMGCSRHSARANISQTIRRLKRAWEEQ
jgi:DNA-directed RNA polymerase specialized sigma24 family protein